MIKDIRNAVDPYANDGCTTHASDFPGFEVTVALMEKLQIANASPQEAAQSFAVQLFDLWGVGDSGCQNGVLLLLSRQDRQVLFLTLPEVTLSFQKLLSYLVSCLFSKSRETLYRSPSCLHTLKL